MSDVYSPGVLAKVKLPRKMGLSYNHRYLSQWNVILCCYGDELVLLLILYLMIRPKEKKYYLHRREFENLITRHLSLLL